MPGYQAGVPDRPGAGGDRRRRDRPARLERVAVPAAPEGRSRRSRGPPAAMNRYPDPDATLLRRRIAERYETEPGRIAVGNGSCEILLAAAEALCEPGRRDRLRLALVLDVPVPGGALGGARDPGAARRGRRPRPRGDGRRGDRRDPAADRLQPEQPDRRPTCRRREIAAFCERDPRPRDGDPRRGLRRVPDRRRSRRDARPARRVPQPGRPAHLQQVSTGWPGCGSATRSAPPTSAPRSTPCASRSASTRSPRRPGAEAILHSDDVAAPGRARRSSSGSTSRRACASSASRPPTPRPTSPGSTSARPTRREVVAGLAERRIAVRPGTPLGGPGHIRVSYGTRRRERPLPRSASASCSTNGGPSAKKSAVVIRSGMDTTSEPSAVRAALAPAALSYCWRFS